MIICPDNCAGGHRKRQQTLTDHQENELSEAAQQAVNKSKGLAKRCDYCGCVYLNEDHGQTILGYLDGGVEGKGWSSDNYA